MTNLGRTLEREMDRIAPADYPLELVARRRDRRRRTRRVSSGLVALTIALVAVGWMARSFRAAPDVQPAALPSSGQLAFISPGGGGWEDRLFTMPVAGGPATRVVDIHAEYPDWSPDATVIAFDDGENLHGASRAVPNGHIYTVGADGSGFRQITFQGAAFSPSWSPDGTRLAVGAHIRGSAAGIAWVDLSTGTKTAVTSNPFPGYWDGEPDVSPTGDRIAFIRVRELIERGGQRNLAAIFVVDADGSGLRRLTPWHLDAGTPTWSPDGTRIAFNNHDHSIENDPSQIFTIAPNGSHLTRLTSGTATGSFWPAWSPDGSRIVFTRYGTGAAISPLPLGSIPADGGAVTSLRVSVTDGANQVDWGRSP